MSEEMTQEEFAEWLETLPDVSWDDYCKAWEALCEELWRAPL